ncbi:MAG: translation initiation factor IF-5A [Nanoarchaeota archaeon]|nr:translation initiation factor IF-5A [Nanoarchaeota archaeon]
MTETKTAIKSLKPGRYCLIDGEPCKVISVSISASGKHGAAKARLEAVGVFDNNKRSIVKPANSEFDVPVVEKKNGQVVAILENTAQVMDLENYETFDAIVPEELKDKVTQGCEVQYWILCGRKMLVGVK